MDLICDFRQFYGIDLPLPEDAEGLDFDMLRWSVLWEGLPRESRTARRLDASLEWSPTDYLLHSIEFSARWLQWARTKDGARGRNAPKPIQTPGERQRNRQRADAALARRKAIDRVLGMTTE